MFCDTCGSAAQPGQKFCGACGKTLGAPVLSPGQGRVAQHIQLLAIFWLIFSALTLLLGMALVIVANVLFAHFVVNEGTPAPPFVQPLLNFLALLTVARALAGLLAAWGLQQRRPWARMLTIVLALLSILEFPFGTALGIYTLWVLLAPAAEQEYRSLAPAG